MTQPLFLSIIVPVFNEEDCLQSFFKRIMPVMKDLGHPFEAIYINDGSSDKSFELLEEHHKDYPDQVKVIEFDQNYGQHMAILAGFEAMQGDVAINLDADLQNPPEEIPKLVDKIKEGYDMVGSYRMGRKDHKWRHYGSRFANHVRGLITPLKMKDQGCMFRAYSRKIVQKICRGNERALFIPALGWKYAENPTEIGLFHDERSEGDSKYPLYQLLRVSIDLATSTTLVPIQMVTFTGIFTSLFSFLLFIYLLLRRLLIGPEVEGVFTLIALVIFLVGVAIMGIGIIGEYVGRTYQIVCGRPRYIIKKLLSTKDKNS